MDVLVKDIMILRLVLTLKNKTVMNFARCTLFCDSQPVGLPA
jgi:hypothetical protein